jgi:hypothetical protein
VLGLRRTYAHEVPSGGARLSAWREQDPELAAYTGEKIWLWRCEACGFAQPDRIPALPRFFERM